jgi:hypothetical protein
MKDTLLNVEFSLERINSRELAEDLISFYNKQKIDFKSFNANLYGYREEEKEMDIPVDAYEYQNFVVLEDNGNYILLDGFRRLLWNKTVDHDILVRVYKREDLTDTKILQLLVSLNHTKFFAGLGNYYDRGFALALKTVFNIDLRKFYKSFDGYLRGADFKYSYRDNVLYEDKAHKAVSEKIVSENFLEDVSFLEAVSESDMTKSDLVFGAFIYNLRHTNPELKLDAANFLLKIKQNPVLVKQIGFFLKAKDSRGKDIGNKMFEMFANILLNKEGEKSFIERQEEMKEAIAKLKKDKNWYCYTNSKKIMPYDFWQNPTTDNKGVNTFVKEYKEKHEVYPKVKVVVLPSERGYLKEGVYDDFEIVGFTYGSHLMASWEVLDVKRGDKRIRNKFMKDNRYDLSIIEESGFSYKSQNDVYLFIENIFTK